jgi:hypothetical protein
MKPYLHLIKIIAVIVIVFAVFLLIPVKMSFSVNTQGRLEAAQEWLMTKDQNGRISVLLHNRLHGMTEMYGLTQFERQDAVKLLIHPSIKSGTFVQAGDTVGVILSHHLERELTQLEGELQMARAMLKLHQAGEKEAAIEEAKNRLEYARTRADGYRPVYTRAQSLFERGLISDEEYETIQNQSQIYELETAIAEAQFQQALTGERQEQIDYVNTQITVLERNIESLRKQKQDFSLIVPIDGMVYKTHSADTLLMIGDIEEYVLLLPVPIYHKDYLSEGIQVKFKNLNYPQEVKAVLHNVGNRVYFINGTQIVIATVSVTGADTYFTLGMVLACSIQTQPVLLREYIMRYIRPIFHW